MSYERDTIRRMHGYSWGEQPDSDDVVKLNTNENPYPPSPAVGDALKAFDVRSLQRYTQPTADRFRLLAAKHFVIAPENLIVTNGGDELLRMAFTTFLDPSAPFGKTEQTC